MIEYSKKSAREFLLFHQLLFPPREIEGKAGIQKVFKHLRTLQYDPQDPCGKNIDILLQARVRNTHPNDYYHWLYKQRKGIEIYDKELSVVPIEDCALCKGRFPPSRKRKLDKFLYKNKEKLEELMRLVKNKGPLCSREIDQNKKVDIFWESANWSRVALDSLWRSGKLVISHREHGRKYYDLPTRVYGDKFVYIKRRDKKKVREESVLRRVQAVGILPAAGTGSGWKGVGISKEITPLIQKLLNSNELVEIKVNDVKKHYVARAVDLRAFSDLKNKNLSPKISFLPPLDNLLWDRKMIKSIFGFNYIWEAYKPKRAREYGYYALPILFGSKFVGRIELKFNKRENVLEVIGFWPEREKKWSGKIKKSFYDYLKEFMEYLQAEKIRWSCSSPI